MTQEDLGKLLGVKKAAINKYETGTVVNLKRSTIENLCNIFNVTPQYLLSDSDLSQPSSSMQLTEQEEELLNGFRSLSDEQKIRVIAYLEGTLDSSGNLGAMLRSEADKIVNKEKEKAAMSAKKAEVF